MTLEKRRFRDLQAVDQLGLTLDEDGRWHLGGEHVNPVAYEWLWTAGYIEHRGKSIVPTAKGENLLAEPQEREWLLTVKLVVPESPTFRLPRNATRDIYDYERAVGRVQEMPSGDDELFLEEVARFAAVRQHVDNDRIWLKAGDRVTNLATGEEFVGDLTALFPWGPQSKTDEATNPHPVERHVSEYHLLPWFHAHAGRKTAVADATLESLIWAIGDVAPPSGKVVIKVTRRKYLVHTLDVSGGIEEAIFADDVLGGVLMHLEGDVAAFLVQEHVDMTFERRMFVVDGIVVASAGCVEEYHPYSLVAVPDPRMRRRRGVGDPDIIWAEQQTTELVRFASRIAAEIHRQRAGASMPEYVMDVAFGPDGQPLVVEFNGIRNSGLYAVDCGRIIRALTERRGVWGKAPHARPRVSAEVAA